MKREELIKNKGYWISKIQLDLYNQVEKYMKENNLTRAALAEKLGFSKGYITQVLNGDSDHRISKLVELSLAIGKVPEITFQDLNQLIDDEQAGIKTYTWKVRINTTLKQPENLKEESVGTSQNLPEPAKEHVFEKVVNQDWF